MLPWPKITPSVGISHGHKYDDFGSIFGRGKIMWTTGHYITRLSSTAVHMCVYINTSDQQTSWFICANVGFSTCSRSVAIRCRAVLSNTTYVNKKFFSKVTLTNLSATVILAGGSWPFDAHCCNTGSAIKHPVSDRVKPSFVIFDIRAQWHSEQSIRVPRCQ